MLLAEDLVPREHTPERKLLEEDSNGPREEDASHKAADGMVRRGPNKNGGHEASRNLDKSLSRKAREKEPDKRGIASLDEMALLNQVALPLGELLSSTLVSVGWGCQVWQLLLSCAALIWWQSLCAVIAGCFISTTDCL